MFSVAICTNNTQKGYLQFSFPMWSRDTEIMFETKKYVELVFNPVELATNWYVKTEGTESYLVSFLISYLQRTDKRRRGNRRRSTHPRARPACSALKPLSTCSSRKTVKRRVAPSHRLTVLIKVWKQPQECLPSLLHTD